MICIWSKEMTLGLVYNSWNLMSHDILVLEFVTWGKPKEFVTFIHNVTQFPIVSTQRSFLPFGLLPEHLVAKKVGSTLTELVIDPCISSWMNKEWALLIEGNGSMSKIYVLTWENTSLTPIRNFIVDSFAWRLFNFWLILHTHYHRYTEEIG